MRACVFGLFLVSALHAAVRLDYVRQFGGSDTETVAAMTRDPAGNLYVTGRTTSFDFPATLLQLHSGGTNLYRGDNQPIYTHRAANIFSMAVDRVHPGVLFLWTSRGLLRSDDYGVTWTSPTSGLPANSGGTLAIDPRDGRTLYLATTLSGIFKSSDAGATWTLSNSGILTDRSGFFPDQIALDPGNPTILLASDSFDGPTLYRSTDAGATWQLQAGIPIRSVVFDIAHPGVAYATNGSQVLRSTDHAATWSTLPSPSGNAGRLTVDSNGSIYYAYLTPGMGYNVAVSRDAGDSWTSREITGNVYALAAARDSLTVYLATDYQVFASTDGFATSRITTTPAPVRLFSFASPVDPRSPSVLFTILATTAADAYVMKLDPTGNLLWATYLGGSRDDVGTGIAVDGTGNVYVTGNTASADFPVTPGALTSKSGAGGFVAKISPDGRLIYSATLTDPGVLTGIAVDRAGNAYVAGTVTEYIAGGFFSIPKPHATACKLDVSGSQFLYCTKLDSDTGNAIAADADGSAYLAGNFNLWKLSPAGTLAYRRSLQGIVRTMALDSHQNLYLAGNTTDVTFPTTPGAFQRQFNAYRFPIAGEMVAYSDDHGFVMRINPDTGETLNSTLLQGENWEHVLVLALDAAGNLAVGGTTASSSFPLMGAFQTRFAYYTGFVSRLSADLSTLLSSTYVGDTRNFQVSGLAVADDGSIAFAGDTSNASNFFSGTNVPAAGADIFVAGLRTSPSAPPALLGVLNSASMVGTRIAPNQSITVVTAGPAPDAEVLLDGQPLPLLSTASGRIVARIPSDNPVSGASTVRVRSGGLLSDPLLIAGSTAAPAIYTRDGSGFGEALVYHEDGTLNSPDNPAAPGSIIAVACNGVGPVTFDGDYAVAATPVSVYVDGFYADGVDAHMLQLPGIPGDTYVIRVRVPDPQIAGFKMPALVSLTLNIGGTSNASGILSQADVAISIQSGPRP